MALRRVRLPGCYGGCGIRRAALAPHAHAAMHAAHHINAGRIIDIPGALGVSRTAAREFLSGAPELAAARSGLRDAGIEVDVVGAPSLGVEAAAADAATP